MITSRSIHSICSGLLIGTSLSALAIRLDTYLIALVILAIVNMVTWFIYLHRNKAFLMSGYQLYSKQLPETYYSEYVMTVRELKDFLENFPDDAEVWVGDRCGRSNEVKCLSVLNENDIILEPTQDGFE